MFHKSPDCFQVWLYHFMFPPAVYKEFDTSHPSVQFSRTVVSESLWLHELQHARPTCPSPTLRVHSNSCTSSRWCHPAISSFVVPFYSCPPIPPSIRVFSTESTLRMRWPKYWSFSFSIFWGLVKIYIKNQAYSGNDYLTAIFITWIKS